MATFEKKVTFEAYQFVPEKLANLNPYEIEDVITSEFADIELKDAFVTQSGRLEIIVYTYGETPKELFTLTPYQWLVSGGYVDFEVVSDEKFQSFATAI